MLRNSRHGSHGGRGTPYCVCYFGGKDADNNYIELPYDIHRAFHNMGNRALKYVGEKTMYAGEDYWEKALKDPNTRAKVKQTLLQEAANFDLLCAGIGLVPKTGGTEPRWMYETMTHR